DLKLQRIDELKLLRVVAAQRVQLTLHGRQMLVRLGDFAAQSVADGKRVEQFKMSARIEERLLIALPVNVDEKLTHVAQQRLGRELVVDEDLVAAGGGKLATDDQFLIKSKTGVFQQQREIRI